MRWPPRGRVEGTGLRFILEAKERNTVFWIERRGDRWGGSAHTAQCFSAGHAYHGVRHPAAKLFEHLESAVLTSATLAVAGGFEYIRNRLGIQHARELVVQSHFDYREPGTAVRSARPA